ncbi:helix-turn-helix domain-containing protein [Lactococcus cremoris]|uniref:helix-turn-helix domain-containing protein n=1 Tax=Lactococcus lactis subsp. cremoris TaxID=1359 RepID=UPI002203D464|nr:helix-turn-helix transcriptional regulator [Lactococcus cremoris]UXV61611.1 helix-turn-helix transcriptional regulator [Lactococcus cremoris]
MDESIFYKRLKLLSKNLGKSLNQVEKELGYSRNGLNNYKTNHMPSALRLLELSEYFNVSPEYLFGKSELYELKGHDDKNSAEIIFRRLDEKQKLNMCKITNYWLIHEKNVI